MPLSQTEFVYGLWLRIYIEIEVSRKLFSAVIIFPIQTHAGTVCRGSCLAGAAGARGELLVSSVEMCILCGGLDVVIDVMICKQSK